MSAEGKITRGPVASGVQRRLAAIGILCFLLAGILLPVALLVEFPAGSQTVSAGSSWRIAPATGYPLSVRVDWTGGVGATKAYLVDQTPSCTGTAGVVVVATGPSGSFRAELDPGKSYELFACTNASFQTVTFTAFAQRVPVYTIPLLAAGAAAIVGGVTFLVLGSRPPRYRPPQLPRRYPAHR